MVSLKIPKKLLGNVIVFLAKKLFREGMKILKKLFSSNLTVRAESLPNEQLRIVTLSTFTLLKLMPRVISLIKAEKANSVSISRIEAAISFVPATVSTQN